MIFIFFILLNVFSPVLKEPPWTAPVPGMHNVYLDIHEVTNQQWLAYLSFLKGKYGVDSEEYKLAIPDTNIWKQSYNVHFFDPGIYLYYPVVGISFPQVKEFCRWRSRESSEMRNKAIEYSLPTKSIYEICIEEDSTRTAAGLYSLKFDHRRKFIGLCDNAAEMLNVEGKAIEGFNEKGSCLDEMTYQKANANLGFRCMAIYK